MRKYLFILLFPTLTYSQDVILLGSAKSFDWSFSPIQEYYFNLYNFTSDNHDAPTYNPGTATSLGYHEYLDRDQDYSGVVEGATTNTIFEEFNLSILNFSNSIISVEIALSIQPYGEEPLSVANYPNFYMALGDINTGWYSGIGRWVTANWENTRVRAAWSVFTVGTEATTTYFYSPYVWLRSANPPTPTAIPVGTSTPTPCALDSIPVEIPVTTEDLPTLTPTPSSTVTNTPTWTWTPTPTPVGSWVPPTPTSTPTRTNTPTFTYTFTPLPTGTNTPTFTYTPTFTQTPTFWPTPTGTFTPTFTYTPTYTPTFTNTPTVTNSPTALPTNTLIPTPTLAPTPIAIFLVLNNNSAAEIIRFTTGRISGYDYQWSLYWNRETWWCKLVKSTSPGNKAPLPIWASTTVEFPIKE